VADWTSLLLACFGDVKEQEYLVRLEAFVEQLETSLADRTGDHDEAFLGRVSHLVDAILGGGEMPRNYVPGEPLSGDWSPRPWALYGWQGRVGMLWNSGSTNRDIQALVTVWTLYGAFLRPTTHLLVPRFRPLAGLYHGSTPPCKRTPFWSSFEIQVITG